MLIWKKRNGVNDWIVYHSQNTSAPATDHLHLNNTNATSDPSGSTFFQDTLPTSTVFSIGTDDDVNDAKNYVCIVSFNRRLTQSLAVILEMAMQMVRLSTGFRPAFVMVKRTDSAGNWHILDNKRAFAGNEIDVRLEADNNDTENTSGPPHTDLVMVLN